MPSRYAVNGPDHTFPDSTDWSAYGECPTCASDPGQVCRNAGQTHRIGRGKAVSRPHSGRKRVARDG